MNNTLTLSDTVEIPWHQLRKSDANIRTVAPGNLEDDALIANIGETGVLLENLIVTPLNDDTFGVHAGGRRFSAIGENIKNGVLPRDFPVPCRIQTGGSLTAVSVAENLHAPMHPADEFTAFQQMQNDGLSVEDIALQYGLPKQRVCQRLKLAQVAKRILNAYRRDEIDLKTVMAFTLARSQKQQLDVFKTLSGRCHAYSVKQALTGDTINSDDRLVRYVGLDTYQAEGGRLVTDLFADHDHLPDRALVEQLALAKLEKAATRLTEREGWSQIKVSLERYIATHEYHHIEPEPVDVPESLTQRLAELIDTQNQLHEAEGEWTDKEDTKDEALTQAIEAAETEIDGYRAYTDEQKANAQCFLTISDTGKTHIARGYLTRYAARKATSDSPATANTTPQALLHDLGLHRQQIAKVALLSDPTLASDLLLYTLCHDILTLGYQRKAIDARFEVVQPYDEKFNDCNAMHQLDAARSRLPTGWLDIESPTARFNAFRKLTPKRKQTLLAYCVSATFTTGFHPTDPDDIAEAVLVTLKPDYAALWRPTGEQYFKRLTRPALVTLGAELFGEKWATAHTHDKKRALVGWFDQFFNGKAPKGLSDAERMIRNNWLPEGFVGVPIKDSTTT
jgi:ParB family transcriptional regulator, chromosome partitioning protein